MICTVSNCSGTVLTQQFTLERLYDFLAPHRAPTYYSGKN
jgi:hypothetical protein